MQFYQFSLPVVRDMNKSIFTFVEKYLIRLIFAKVKRMEIFNLSYKQLKLLRKKTLVIHKLDRYILKMKENS